MVHCFVIVDVDGEGDFFYYVESVCEGFFEGLYNDDGVYVAL